MNNQAMLLRDRIKTGHTLLGKPVKQVHEFLNLDIDKNQKQINEIMEEFRAKKNVAGELSEAVYWGSVSINGFVRGDIAAHILFGDSGNWTFSGTCWCGPQAIAGGGLGAWSLIPSQGQKMDFAYGAAALTGGEVQVYWSTNGIVVGQLVAVVGGVAISGGSGDGKWTKD